MKRVFVLLWMVCVIAPMASHAVLPMDNAVLPMDNAGQPMDNAGQQSSSSQAESTVQRSDLVTVRLSTLRRPKRMTHRQR